MYSTSQFGLATFQGAQVASGYCVAVLEPSSTSRHTFFHLVWFIISFPCVLSPQRDSKPPGSGSSLKAVHHIREALQACLLMGVSAGN